MGRRVRAVREPGGTSIGEEIRHTLKHSSKQPGNDSRSGAAADECQPAQLLREVIRPALEVGEIVCAIVFTILRWLTRVMAAGMDLEVVNAVIDLAVGNTRPDITFLLVVPEASANRDLPRDSPRNRSFETASKKPIPHFSPGSGKDMKPLRLASQPVWLKSTAPAMLKKSGPTSGLR